MTLTLTLAACSGSDEVSDEVEEDASTVDTASDDASGGDTTPVEDTAAEDTVEEDTVEEDTVVEDTVVDDTAEDALPDVPEDVAPDVAPDVTPTEATLAGVVPICGSNAGGYEAQLSGSSLTDVGTVLFGAAATSPTSTREDRVFFTMPPATDTIGFVDVSVEGDNLTAPPLADGFYYHDDFRFTATEIPVLGTFRGFIALGDVDGDGRADRVLADETGIIVERVASDVGAWTTSTTLDACGNPSALAVGDIDGDELGDVVVGCASELTILLGEDGLDPDPSTSVLASAGANPFHEELILRDLNGDDALDIIERWQGSEDIYVYLNAGGGTFTGPTAIPMGPSMTSIEVADVFGSDAPELITGHFSENLLRVRPGNGDGTFGAIVESAIPGIQTLTAGEFDGEPKSELVVGSNDAGVGATVFTFDGTGEASRFLQLVGGGLLGTGVTDLDGDGADDGVVATNPGLRFYLSSVPDPLACSVPVELDGGVRKMLIDDINGDGFPDVASFNGGNNRLVTVVSVAD